MAPDINQETTFNEAVLKMQRIHSAQEIINNVRINLLAWNQEYSKYNYEVVISSLISLCYEVFPLMKEIEQKEFHLVRGLLDDLMANKPVFENISGSNFNGSNNSSRINVVNWKTLRDVMFKFEDFARGQVDSHGLSAPKKKDAGKAAIDL
jgi:hypothetical protein